MICHKRGINVEVLIAKIRVTIQSRHCTWPLTKCPESGRIHVFFDNCSDHTDLI